MNSLNSKDNSMRVNFLGIPKTREKTKKHLLTFSFQHQSEEAVGFVMDIFPIYHFATLFRIKELDILKFHLNLFDQSLVLIVSTEHNLIYYYFLINRLKMQ